MEQTNAADNLKGRKLSGGWEVIDKIDRPQNSTGSFFSKCYKVKKGNTISFLKAFDFAKFFQTAQPGKQVIDVMADMIEAYKYEKELSELCRNHHVTKVAFVKDAGEEIIDGYTISVVPYLIFDLADGDVRSKIDFSNKLDFTWKLKSLHEIAVGLKQLHYIEVSHQDLKPSNILLFKQESKIGDIGRSVCKRIKSPYDELFFTGDFNYAPPEIMYGYYDADWNRRVFATDCYLLGSMVVFYFTAISMTAMLSKYIPHNFRWEVWRGSFDEIKPYIADAFSKALDEFELIIENEYLKNELRWLVERLCFPFPENRGHPKNILSIGSSYNLERIVSKFDYLHKRARYNLLK